MSPPRKNRFEEVFEVIQAVSTLTFLILMTMLAFKTNHSDGYKLLFGMIMFLATAMVSFFLTKQWKALTVLWFVIVSVLLAIAILLMVF